jgi:membrane-associated phospholipid phosphatase
MHPASTAALVFLAGYAVLVASMVGVGLLLTEVLVDGGVGTRDVDATEWFEAERSDLSNVASLLSSNAAATLVVIGIASLAVVVLAVRRRWRDVMFLVVALTLEVSVFLTATLLVSRRRPEVEHLDATPPTDSYPSGHTAAAVVLYAGLVAIASRSVPDRARRWLLMAFGVIVPLSVAVARVYRGMHHPTDVLAGVALGAACLVVGLLAVRTAWPDEDRAIEEGRPVRSIEHPPVEPEAQLAQ